MMRRGMLALAAVVVLAAACGGGDDGDGGNGGGGDGGTVSTDEYATSVCTALKDYIDTISEQSKNLQGALDPGTQPEEGKSTLTDYIGTVIEATSAFGAAVRDAGTPDVDGGEAIASALATAAETAEQILNQAKDQIAQLPTDNPQAFVAAAQQLSTTVQSAFEQAGNPLQGIDSPELEQAFNDNPNCKGAAG
jgi:hypothetical protein